MASYSLSVASTTLLYGETGTTETAAAGGLAEQVSDLFCTRSGQVAGVVTLFGVKTTNG